MNDTDAGIRTVQKLIMAIEPILAGHRPEIQGATLADLLATWLAGHSAGTIKLRAALLATHIGGVKMLVPIKELINSRKHPRTRYVIVRNVAQYPVADTWTVVDFQTHENLSHHESESEALAAVKRYKQADQRRARAARL